MGTQFIRKFETKNENTYKVYVPVNVTFDADGKMYPTHIRWEDGTVYQIDRILRVLPRPALKAGGQGDRYEIVIGGKVSYLFYEHNPDSTSSLPGKWFTERKEPYMT